MNYKPENRIPWLLTDFDNIKDFPWLLKKFPDFSLTLKNFRFPLTFPWHILIWNFFSTFCQGIFCYFRQASCDGVRFQACFWWVQTNLTRSTSQILVVTCHHAVRISALAGKPVVASRRGWGTPGNSWWGFTAWFSKSWPYFRPKTSFFTSVFRPGLNPYPLSDLAFKKLCPYYLD